MGIFTVFSLFFLSLPCRAGQDWSLPPIPELRFVHTAPAAGRMLYNEVLRQGIPMLAASDYDGLGRQASVLQAWVRPRHVISLVPTDHGYHLQAEGGEILDISKELGLALAHMNQYFEMTPAALKNPITHEDLRRAFLSPEGAARTQALFDDMLAHAIRTPGKVIFPETGGKATVHDDVIDFHQVPDMTRPPLSRIAEVLSDPDRIMSRAGDVSELYRLYPQAMADIDASGLLRDALTKLPARRARGTPEAQLLKLMKLALETALENSSDSWILEPEEEFKVIARDVWRGRYAGHWHTHPPGLSPEGWKAAGPPSGPDMENARQSGQFLTLSFHPEGFDVYDLSGLAGLPEIEPARIRKISYRSAQWREHFQKLHSRMKDSASSPSRN